MAAIQVTTPLTLKTAEVSFKIGSETSDFSDHINQIELIPSTSSTKFVPVSGNIISDTAPTSWEMKLGLVQDMAPTGLLKYLYTNDGKECVITAKLQGTLGMVTATVNLVAAPIGGTADGTMKTSSITVPCSGKPTWS